MAIEHAQLRHLEEHRESLIRKRELAKH
jgi:hypothetical protein